MKKMLLLCVALMSFGAEGQTQVRKPVDDKDIGAALEFIAVMGAGTEGDPSQKNLTTPADTYKMLVKRCEESGIDGKRILEIAKEAVDRYATLVDGTGHKAFTFNSVRLLAFMAESGDRSILPYLEEKSLNPETDKLIRSAAAEAYVKLATAEECAAFMKRAFDVNDDKGFWRFTVSRQFLAKIEAAFNTGEISEATKQRVLSVLLGYLQSPANPSEASKIDEFLVKKCEGYQDSLQRMVMAQGFLGGDNERVTKLYATIHESVAQLPLKQRVDLRKRFPELPPLPKEQDAGGPLKVALGVGAGLAVLGALAAWLAIRRRKPRETA